MALRLLDRKRCVVTVPENTILDLGATAKALAADRAASTIHRELGCGTLVSLGGDAAAAGPAPAEGFVIGIADACTSPIASEAVSIFTGGLASSGIGVRQWRLGTHRVHHIVDPTTCLPATSYWRVVTTTAGTCVQANAASTAAMVLGEHAVEWLEGLGLPARLERVDGEVFSTSGWPIPQLPPLAQGDVRPVTTALVATVGHGSTALWYLTRATGLVSLIVLSATVVLGTVASVGWTTDRWPRFLSQSVHRNLSLFCLALIGIHVVSTVGDGYVPIGLSDAVIPFRSPYRPIWVGLGALALDMLLAVAITSALRRRIGVAAWRGVHWLAYACWPIAAVHGLGSGSDARLPGTMLVFVVCTGSVAAAVGLATGGRTGTVCQLAARWRRCGCRRAARDHRLRRRRTAATRLVPSGRDVPCSPGAVGGLGRPLGLRPPRRRRTSRRPQRRQRARVSRPLPSRPPCRGRSPRRRPMPTASHRSP